MPHHPIVKKDEFPPGFHIFRGDSVRGPETGEHYWRLCADNHQVLGISEGYSSADAADEGIFAAKRAVLEAIGIREHVEQLQRETVAARAHRTAAANSYSKHEEDEREASNAESRAEEAGESIVRAILPIIDPGARPPASPPEDRS